MRRTILLADDSPTIRRLVKQTFADADFDVIEFSHGEAAIKAFDEVRPNVVLADIYMPGQNGYQVCSFVRSHPVLGKTPVVLLVGAFDAFDEESARQAGATANITKPFEPGALVDLVNSVLLPEQEDASRRPEPSPPVAGPAEKAQVDTTVVEKPSVPAEAAPPAPAESDADLLGLKTIFKEEPKDVIRAITEQEIDRIADRVIKKISTQVIENIAWEVVPDITEKIVREELKRSR
jgi:CheY-like chemotaxis protein